MDRLDGVPFRGRLIKSGEYGDNFRREDGSVICWVSLMDESSDRPDATFTASLAPDVDLAKLPDAFTEVVAELSINAAVTKGGAPRLKFRCMSLRPATVKGNGAQAAVAATTQG